MQCFAGKASRRRVGTERLARESTGMTQSTLQGSAPGALQCTGVIREKWGEGGGDIRGA